MKTLAVLLALALAPTPAAARSPPPPFPGPGWYYPVTGQFWRWEGGFWTILQWSPALGVWEPIGFAFPPPATV